ncbi:hypothetical protein Naga_101353g2 [Nannochloropsis gaditana]|uniref:Uncharacterized protein n=1 Tax=Nannochloropsis gaditana TaxID=72520 RepID=W7T1S8_9STRA|nr:hypothetical protein Naga_101353g2 [Nannochloropsis gaditana]
MPGTLAASRLLPCLRFFFPLLSMALWKPLTAFVFPPTSSFPCGSAPFTSQPALWAQPILSSAERLTINEPVLREIALKLEAVGLGKTHLVQDKSLGPGLHVR